MYGGANGYNSGINTNSDGASNDEKKELARLNKEMEERQAKKKKVSRKKKKANAKGRRSTRARARGRGKRCVSKKLGDCGLARRRRSRRRSRR